jgi:fructose-bisphosphate aldolase class I
MFGVRNAWGGCAERGGRLLLAGKKSPDLIWTRWLSPDNHLSRRGSPMNDDQFHKIQSGHGFIAALDQSGGSTPAALRAYGIDEDQYTDDDEMFALMHAMRSRIVTSPSFSGDQILGAILFEDTMDRAIEGQGAVSYLWERKHVVPFLKVDKGLAAEHDGVQVMNPMPALASLLARAVHNGVFGTKMRSFIKLGNRAGITALVDQQFLHADQIMAAGLVPIIEPEVDVHSPEKAKAEEILKECITVHLEQLRPNDWVMLKLSLPDVDDFYADFVAHPNVVRVVALSGGYGQREADVRLSANHGVIASFSRALMEGLSVHQSDAAFDATLQQSIDRILQASLT